MATLSSLARLGGRGIGAQQNGMDNGMSGMPMPFGGMKPPTYKPPNYGTGMDAGMTGAPGAVGSVGGYDAGATGTGLAGTGGGADMGYRPTMPKPYTPPNMNIYSGGTSQGGGAMGAGNYANSGTAYGTGANANGGSGGIGMADPNAPTYSGPAAQSGNSSSQSAYGTGANAMGSAAGGMADPNAPTYTGAPAQSGGTLGANSGSTGGLAYTGGAMGNIGASANGMGTNSAGTYSADPNMGGMPMPNGSTAATGNGNDGAPTAIGSAPPPGLFDQKALDAGYTPFQMPNGTWRLIPPGGPAMGGHFLNHAIAMQEQRMAQGPKLGENGLPQLSQADLAAQAASGTLAGNRGGGNAWEQNIAKFSDPTQYANLVHIYPPAFINNEVSRLQSQIASPTGAGGFNGGISAEQKAQLQRQLDAYLKFQAYQQQSGITPQAGPGV